jgi:Lrp/AsnC family leucine-responsive transcriptional regulator
MEVSAAALGLPVTAFARIRPAPGRLPGIAKLAAELPEVSECHRVTGENCFLIKVNPAAIEDLEYPRQMSATSTSSSRPSGSITPRE